MGQDLTAVVEASRLGKSLLAAWSLGEVVTQLWTQALALLQPGPRQLEDPLPMPARALPPDHTSAWLFGTYSRN